MKRAVRDVVPAGTGHPQAEFYRALMGAPVSYEIRVEEVVMESSLTSAQQAVRAGIETKWSVVMVTATKQPGVVRMCGVIGGDVEMDVTFVAPDGTPLCRCLKREATENFGMCEYCYDNYLEAKHETGR